MLTVTADTLACRISAALHREFGDRACAVQRIARAMPAPADPRAVRNWWAGTNAPRSADLLNLASVSPEVRQELVTILAAQARNEANLLELKRQQHVLSQSAAEYLGGPVHVDPQTAPCVDHRNGRPADEACVEAHQSHLGKAGEMA